MPGWRLSISFAVLEIEPGVDPVDDPRLARLVGDLEHDGAFQDLRRVEDVVDLLVLHETVEVDAGPGDVELGADKGIVGGDLEVHLPPDVVGDLRDHRGVDPVVVAVELDVLEDEAFDRRVSRALADAHQGAVGAAAAIEPRRRGVDQGLVEVVVAVPLEQVPGHARVLDEGPDDLVHASGQGRTGIGDPVAHGVAEADLDVDAALLAQFHQLDGKGDHEAVDVRPGEILEMAPGDDPRLEDGAHHVEIHLHGLLACDAQLEEDVIVRHRREDARLLEAHLLDQGDVLLDGADPAGDLGVAKIQAAAGLERLAVALAVKEELRLADDALFAAEPAHHLEQVADLLDRIGRPGLLAVPEGRVGDEDVLGGAHRDELVIEDDAADLFVGEDVFLEVRLIDVLHLIAPEFRVLVIEDLLFLVPFCHVDSPCTCVECVTNRPGGFDCPVPAENKKGRKRFGVPSLVSSFSKLDSTSHGGTTPGRNDRRLRFSGLQACRTRPHFKPAVDVPDLHHG